MLRFVVACCIVLLIAVLFIFSRTKQGPEQCDRSLVGIVKEHHDSTGFFLYIKSNDSLNFYPLIEKEDVVLASGARVSVCYDTTGKESNGQPVIRINRVTYLP